MKTKLEILEVYAGQLEDAGYKNQFMADCSKEYLGIVNKEKLSAEQIYLAAEREALLDMGKVFVFCAGEAQDAVQLSWEELPECFTLEIVGLVFAKDLLGTAGNYNYRLDGMTDFEFLLRLGKANGSVILVFEGMEESALEVGEKEAKACAYLFRSVLEELKRLGKTEQVLQLYFMVMEQFGMSATFREELGKMLEDEAYYEKISIVTAPFLILRGDDTCYGVLQDFADSIYEGLRSLGQACILVGQAETDYESLRNRAVKGVIGFQAIALEIDYFKKLHGPKIQFWMDNPVFSAEHFSRLSEDCYVLCHDSNYTEFIRKEYHRENAKTFPLAAKSRPWKETGDRPYDIVFVGTYLPDDLNELPGNDFPGNCFLRFMLTHPHSTFAEGVEYVWEQQGILSSKRDYGKAFPDMQKLCLKIINHYRKKTMDTILEAGYEVHVYGESWRVYDSPWADRLIIHPAVKGNEAVNELQKAKIGLNMMSWHKAGMTERIANIMLSGAVCLSEETSYLAKHFENGKQLVTFRLDALEELSGKIERILQGDKWLEIARAGYETASREHTWERRSRQLLQLVEREI